MVQLLADPAISSQHGTPTTESGDWTWSNTSRSDTTSNNIMSREEHAQRIKELHMKRGLKKAPRRGWSMTECLGDTNGPHPPQTAIPTSQFDRYPPIPENGPLPSPALSSGGPSTPVIDESAPKDQQIPRRPKLPPPRRSYSVMDYEPARPNEPKPSHRLTLLDLPSEIHYAFCDYLDPIDSACFGLAHSKLYAIHRRKYGTVPLNARYSGPNDMEWAWRGAGPLVRSNTQLSDDELSRMRIKGQVYCRKCGVSRCELHRHLKDWMGPHREYCGIKEIFGAPAEEGAKDYCYMSSPKNPNRCGRHRGKRI